VPPVSLNCLSSTPVGPRPPGQLLHALPPPPAASSLCRLGAPPGGVAHPRDLSPSWAPWKPPPPPALMWPRSNGATLQVGAKSSSAGCACRLCVPALEQGRCRCRPVLEVEEGACPVGTHGALTLDADWVLVFYRAKTIKPSLQSSLQSSVRCGYLALKHVTLTLASCYPLTPPVCCVLCAVCCDPPPTHSAAGDSAGFGGAFRLSPTIIPAARAHSSQVHALPACPPAYLPAPARLPTCLPARPCPLAQQHLQPASWLACCELACMPSFESVQHSFSLM
jgi:hypothetical protein